MDSAGLVRRPRPEAAMAAFKRSSDSSSSDLDLLRAARGAEGLRGAAFLAELALRGTDTIWKLLPRRARMFQYL